MTAFAEPCVATTATFSNSSTVRSGSRNVLKGNKYMLVTVIERTLKICTKPTQMILHNSCSLALRCAYASMATAAGRSDVAGCCCHTRIWTQLYQACVIIRAVKRLISLIAVLTHILFVRFFSLFVLHLHVDVVGPLLLNASLLLVLMTDYNSHVRQLTRIVTIAISPLNSCCSKNAKKFNFLKFCTVFWETSAKMHLVMLVCR